MIVGIDIHKRTHTAALLDARGGEIGTLCFANSRDGIQRLRAWLAAHDAGDAVIGVENAAGYGRLVCGALSAAGHEVLNVPAWRTHRDRHTSGPGKSDPGDALAIAHVVLRKRAQLGRAREPELIRAIALLETLRRQSVEWLVGRGYLSAESISLVLTGPAEHPPTDIKEETAALQAA